MAGARQIAKQAAISNGVTAKCEAVRADAGARVCDPSHAVLIPRGKAMERAKGIEPSYAAWENESLAAFSGLYAPLTY
jgi:hypothetical protein